jgi:hypothetical protein
MTEINSVDTRAEIIKYLGEIESHYAAYHNHKETTAWASLVLWGAVVVGVMNVFGKEITNVPQFRYLVTGLVLLIAGLTSLYLKTQFSLRRDAANIVAACFSLRTTIVSNLNFSINPLDYVLVDKPKSFGQSGYILPKKVLEEAEMQGTRGLEPLITLEIIVYSFLGLTAVMVLAWIWRDVCWEP